MCAKYLTKNQTKIRTLTKEYSRN